MHMMTRERETCCQTKKCQFDTVKQSASVTFVLHSETGQKINK